jgi:uncharacterized membrane protein YphA (DoxX/SURF4 family)
VSNKPLFGSVLSNDVFPLIARLFISAIFVQGALGKILEWSGQASYMQSHNLPAQLIAPMLAIALLIEVGGALCVVLGFNPEVLHPRELPRTKSEMRRRRTMRAE